MYTDFYNLTEKPFNLTPSPRFLYLSEGHKEALALLKYGVLERKGFILLTGEVGTGKTTMVRALLDSLDSSIMYVHLSNPLLSPHEFINYLACSTIKKEGFINAKAKFLLTFQAFLKRCLKENKNFNLIIDEAHKLSFEVLEEIRLLSNMETGDQKLMNIFLVGQPELNEKLSEIRSRPLLQRISIRHHIPPLNLNETRAYMSTRLKVAGANNIDDIFSKNAVAAIYQYSNGYPREINILADNALLLGYSKGIKRITLNIIKASYEDMRLDHSSFKKEPKRLKSSSNKNIFRISLRRWKYAMLLILIIAVPVFAATQDGKDFISKLLSIIPQQSGTKQTVPQQPISTPNQSSLNQTNKTNQQGFSDKTNRTNETNEMATQGLLSEKIVTRKIFDPGIEDSPDPKQSDPIPETNKTDETNKTEITNEVDKINKTNETIVLVKSGDTFSKIVARVYGHVLPEYVELVKEHNPQISNINAIEVGQTIVFPPLDGPIKKIEDSVQKTE